jgi:uncharacterized membrane protein
MFIFSLDSSMNLSQIVFRTSFVVLVVIYFMIVADFLSPELLSLAKNIRFDVIALTAGVVAYIYIFLLRSR